MSIRVWIIESPDVCFLDEMNNMFGSDQTQLTLDFEVFLFPKICHPLEGTCSQDNLLAKHSMD